MRLILIAIIISCSAISLAHADDRNFNLGNPKPNPNSSDAPVNYIPPVEPNIQKVKYLMPNPTTTLRERVDRLLYGIKVDLPPEYDHYGYEIRRYMAHVAGPEVLGNEARLKEELNNIANAKIVYKYWREDILKQIDAIEKEIAEKNVSGDIHSSFKFNSGVASAFLSECQVWLNRNENMLKFLLENQDNYDYHMPEFNFYTSDDREKFADLYISSQEARKVMNRYVSFATMVY